MRVSSKTLLAIDTSTRTVGLALYNGFQVLSESVWTSRDYHTVELAPAVREALKKAGVSPNSLDALAVAIGPGSFTGLRIGLAFVKGLAMVRRLPIVGVPTLDFLAAAQPVINTSMAAVLRAGRGRLAVGWYAPVDGSWQAEGDVDVLSLQEFGERAQSPVLVCGELTAVERDMLLEKNSNIILASPAQSIRRPAFLAELAWKRWQSGRTDNPATMAPIYLHYHDPIPE